MTPGRLGDPIGLKEHVIACLPGRPALSLLCLPWAAKASCLIGSLVAFPTGGAQRRKWSPAATCLVAFHSLAAPPLTASASPRTGALIYSPQSYLAVSSPTNQGKR